MRTVAKPLGRSGRGVSGRMQLCVLLSPPEGTAYHKIARQEGSCGDKERNGFLTLQPHPLAFHMPPHPHQPVRPFTSSCAIIGGGHLAWRAGEEVGGNGKVTEQEKYFYEKLGGCIIHHSHAGCLGDEPQTGEWNREGK